MQIRLALLLFGAAVCVSLAAALLAPHGARRSSAATCETPLDLMLVIDGSGSIFASDFNRMKDFSNGLVDSFAVSDAAARIGVVQFSGQGQGRLEIGLSGNAAAVHGAISGMVQIEGFTDIQEGLALGQGEIAANGRAGVPHIIILLTDGQQEGAPGDPVAEAAAARAAGTQIYAVGVGGGPNVDQLNAIASDPDSTYVYTVPDFTSLQAIRDQIVATACPSPTAPTTTRTPTGQASSTPVPTSTPGGPSTPTPTPTSTPTNTPGGSNDDPGSCTPVTSGVKTHAAIDAAGDLDYYCISGGLGQQLTVDIDAFVKDSPLDAVVTLFDKNGVTVLAENDDDVNVDPYLVYVLPNAGVYYLRVQSFGHPCCGGPGYVYVLIVKLAGGAPPPTATPTPTPTRTPTSTRTSTPALPPGGPSLLGDVNCDGEVNAIDAAYILQFGAGFLSRLPCHVKGDVDEDGFITAIDAAVILQYSAALIDDLPP